MTTGDPALDFALSLRGPALTALMRAVSSASSPEALVALLPVVYWVFSRRVGLLLFIADGAASLGAIVAKDILATSRPPDAGESAWLARSETPYAFPSGHATSTSAAGFTAAGILRSARGLALAAALTALVSFSRLYLGLHYFADVVGGTVLGVSAAAATVLIAPRVAPAIARLPLAGRVSLGLLFLVPLAVNTSAAAALIAFATSGAIVGHALADAWGWKVETGRPSTLPAYGALRVAIGLPVIFGVGLGLGDPTSAPTGELLLRFFPLGVFVTLAGPRLFMAVERATPWKAGFRR